MRQRITVVGAGVVGLSCAVRLAESGLDVDVLARDLPPETVSALAGALWLPYATEPDTPMAGWARTTLDVLSALAEDGDSGVLVVPGYLRSRASGRPRWFDVLDGTDVLPVDPGTAPGAGQWQLRVPVVDMSRYLPYLRSRLEAADGTVTRMSLPRLPDRGLVVNCTGLAARAMVQDSSLRPVRGECAVLAAPGVRTWRCREEPDRTSVSYVLPRGEQVVVGSTSVPEDGADRSRSSRVAALLARVTELVPELRDAPVLHHQAGLRPERSAVRLEVVGRAHSRGGADAVVHCYGHGDSGITVSWGCAEQVTALVTERLN
jgi:D-amino-acid oxidase